MFMTTRDRVPLRAIEQLRLQKLPSSTALPSPARAAAARRDRLVES